MIVKVTRIREHSSVDPWTAWFALCGSTYMRIKKKKYRYCFWSAVRSPRMGRANCMHWSMTFYVRDLNVHRFWYLLGEEGFWGSWNQFPWTLRVVKILGSQKVYLKFDCTWVGPVSLIFALFKVQRLPKFPDPWPAVSVLSVRNANSWTRRAKLDPAII